MANVFSTYVRLALSAMLAVVVVSALTAAPSVAAATASVGGCTVSPLRPYTYVANGVRYASASIYVTCSVGRSGLTRARIMEADPGFDDTVAPWKQQSMFTIQAGQTTKVGTVTGRCHDFDPIGDEELYTNAQVYVNGLWSSAAGTAVVNTTC